MDDYEIFCDALGLDSQEDSSRDAYNEARIADHEAAMVEADLDAERFAMEFSAVEQGFYDDDPNPYHGDYSEM